MQVTWIQDPGKFTFVLLDPDHNDDQGQPAMAGDVNLFWSIDDDDGDSMIAEVSVMVAEPQSKRKGIAEEAVGLIMAYAVVHLGMKGFRAKIGEGNVASLSMFVDKLGYVEVGRSSVFKEVTLERKLDDVLAEMGKQLKVSRWRERWWGGESEGGGSSND